MKFNLLIVLFVEIRTSKIEILRKKYFNLLTNLDFKNYYKF